MQRNMLAKKWEMKKGRSVREREVVKAEAYGKLYEIFTTKEEKDSYQLAKQ